jgi:transcriptional regulator
MNSVEWRRSKVLELASQGYNQSEISRILPTIKTASKRQHQAIH